MVSSRRMEEFAGAAPEAVALALEVPAPDDVEIFSIVQLNQMIRLFPMLWHHFPRRSCHHQFTRTPVLAALWLALSVDGPAHAESSARPISGTFSGASPIPWNLIDGPSVCNNGYFSQSSVIQVSKECIICQPFWFVCFDKCFRIFYCKENIPVLQYLKKKKLNMYIIHLETAFNWVFLWLRKIKCQKKC